MALLSVFLVYSIHVCSTVIGLPISVDQNRQPALLLNATELPSKNKCGGNDYYDIRTESRLYFYGDGEARRRNAPLRDNKQLQCRVPVKCFDSGVPEEASCVNFQNALSQPQWECDATFPDIQYRFSNYVVNCEKHPELDDHCVLRDSCILMYDPYKPISRSLIFAMTTFVAFIVFCVGATIYSVRRNRAESQIAASGGNVTVQNEYDESTDVPPSYNTVERNPKRFSKPTIVLEHERAETPPPAYETCVESSKI